MPSSGGRERQRHGSVAVHAAARGSQQEPSGGLLVAASPRRRPDASQLPLEEHTRRVANVRCRRQDQLYVMYHMYHLQYLYNATYLSTTQDS